jgi:hypothetical protein
MGSNSATRMRASPSLRTQPLSFLIGSSRVWMGLFQEIKMVYLDSLTAYITQNKLDSGKSVNVNKFHEIIGHCGLDRLKKTVQVHGLKLKGDFKVRENCVVAKAR